MPMILNRCNLSQFRALKVYDVKFMHIEYIILKYFETSRSFQRKHNLVKRNTLQNDDNSSNYETLLEIILDSHVLK